MIAELPYLFPIPPLLLLFPLDGNFLCMLYPRLLALVEACEVILTRGGVEGYFFDFGCFSTFRGRWHDAKDE